jgi:thiamine-phosphate pyrophosphorylase
MSLVFPPLYAIIDASLLKTSELPFAEVLAESGVELLQYRHKHATSRQFFEVCRALSGRLSQFAESTRHDVRFIVNDRPDIAALVRAGGVHVGQTDLGVEEARSIVAPANRSEGASWVGISTHTLAQVDAAERTSADYIAFGPVFTTVTKERPDAVVGLELLIEARTHTSKPLVAIGGITLERASEVYRAGADSLAVARDLIVSGDPAGRAREFLAVAARYSRPAPGSSRGSGGNAQ